MAKEFLTSRGGPGEYKDAVAKYGQVANTPAFAQGQTEEPGAGQRVAEDAVNGERQHGGAPAAKGGSAKARQDTTVPDRNAFNRDFVVFKPAAKIGRKDRLLRDDPP